MRNKFYNKRIPTILGLFLLSIFVGVTSWFANQYTELRGRAASGETPNNVVISNVSDKSFTISYMTDSKTTGIVLYGTAANFGQVAFDDRDKQTGTPGQYNAHFITISSLQPGTKYFFGIQSGATAFLNNSQPYEVTTATSALSPEGQQVLSGGVNMPDGSIPLEGIAFVSFEEGVASVSASSSQVLAALLRSDGSYSIPLNSMRTSDLSSLATFGPQQVLKMTIVSSGGQSTARLLASQINPVPLITLTKDYDFTAGITVVSDNMVASRSASIEPAIDNTDLSTQSAFPTTQQAPAVVFDIITPQDGQKFVDQQPLFQGTALPNGSVSLEIGPVPLTSVAVQADSFGGWQFSPADPLTPGTHVITVKAKDSLGLDQSLSRSFTIFAPGSQFTEPSVSPGAPTLSIEPTLAPTSTPVPSPTALPSATAIPTPNATLTMAAALSLTPNPNSLTLTAAANMSMTPNPESLTLTAAAQKNGGKISATGSSSLLIGAFAVGLFIVAGFVLFFT